MKRPKNRAGGPVSVPASLKCAVVTTRQSSIIERCHLFPRTAQHVFMLGRLSPRFKITLRKRRKFINSFFAYTMNNGPSVLWPTRVSVGVSAAAVTFLYPSRTSSQLVESTVPPDVWNDLTIALRVSSSAFVVERCLDILVASPAARPPRTRNTNTHTHTHTNTRFPRSTQAKQAMYVNIRTLSDE